MSDDMTAAHVRWSEILRREHSAALALVSLGVWLHAADELLIVTMLPAMLDEIGGRSLIGWTIALYEVGAIIAGAASGLLAAKHGIRGPMAAAAAFFALGCALSAVAPTMPVVLAGRLLQGLGGGVMVSITFVAAGLLFPARLMARVMAVVSTLWGVSSFLGPLIGGLFIQLASWRLAFLFFALQALALATWIFLGPRLALLRKPAGAGGRLPVARLGLLSLGVVLIAWGGIDVSPLGTSVSVIAGMLCLALFLRLDARRVSDRLLPPAPFGLRSAHAAALTMLLCFAIATIAFTTYGPILMIHLHGTPALVAGYLVACTSIGWSVCAVAVSGAPERHDPRYIAGGMLLVALSIPGFLHAVPNGPLWLIALCATIEGGGFGLAWTFMLRRLTRLAPEGEAERVAAALPTVQRLGYALGAAYLGIVANAVGIVGAATPAEFAAASTAVFIASLPFAAIGLIGAARFTLRD